MNVINGYEGKYSITRNGKVWSHERIDASGHKRKGKWVKPSVTSLGYLRVGLYIGRSQKWHAVHRLVAKAFILNIENKPHVNHINGDKTDNRVDNLEWVTISENNLHAFRTGLNTARKGERNEQSKLTSAEVIAIRSAKGMKQREIAEIYGVSRQLVSGILRYKYWNHI